MTAGFQIYKIKMNSYYEPQYKLLDESVLQNGLVTLGPMASYTWNSDPKRLLFVLSRYKFAARMLEGSSSVFEVGCGDGFGARIVKQHVNHLLLTDIDPLMVAYAAKSTSEAYAVDTLCHNFIHAPLPELKTNVRRSFDAAYLLDVLEHISPQDELTFLQNISNSLVPNSKVVIGIPSLESQTYASTGSKEGHVNCKTKEEFSKVLEENFKSVVCFSMNDEVIHTGFNRMSNYLFAVCVT